MLMTSLHLAHRMMASAGKVLCPVDGLINSIIACLLIMQCIRAANS
jgi:hypothetical protein